MENDKHIILSVIPTTYCENKCEYCYLGPLRDMRETMKFGVVEQKIKEFKEAGYIIDTVQVYGGDLDREYLGAYMDSLMEDISLATYCHNISLLGHKGNCISLNVERKDYKKNLEYLKQHTDINVIVVVLPKTFKKGPKDLLKTLSKLGWRGYLNVYQYQPSAMADKTYKMTNKQYCDFLIELIDEYLKGNYEFELSIIEDLENNRVGKFEKVFGSHVFLFPSGIIADTRYNDAGLEYFETYHTISEWEGRVEKYKQSVDMQCQICESKDKCMAEHYKKWEDGDVCCGLLPVMQWWEENRGRLNS